ncbi:MAG: hypothetical protein OXJ90_08835 [Spirochaetaceae bacterium]|nr:hypothetical protein [Spirochaetaceae bacterium]
MATATLSLALGGIAKVRRQILAVQRRALVATISCARREIRKVWQRELRREIGVTTTRRTGTLRRTARVRTLREGATVIALATNFPATAYSTPPGRGRRGASKRGQYAFIVNHRAQFIQRSRERALTEANRAIITCWSQVRRTL